MNKVNTEIHFFNYLENYYQKINTITKTKWKTSPNTFISSSHLSLETILIELNVLLYMLLPLNFLVINLKSKK